MNNVQWVDSENISFQNCLKEPKCFWDLFEKSFLKSGDWIRISVLLYPFYFWLENK